MDIYENDRYSLPEQVENNRQNIAILFSSIQNGTIVKSDEILLQGNWVESNGSWKQTVTMPNITSETFSVTVCDSRDDTVLDAFRDIIQSNSIENGMEFYAKSRPSVDIVITVWYNIPDSIDN